MPDVRFERTTYRLQGVHQGIIQDGLAHKKLINSDTYAPSSSAFVLDYPLDVVSGVVSSKLRLIVKRWTDEKVRVWKLPAGTQEKRLAVEHGLYLFARGRADGSTGKHWQYRAQVEGKRRWLSLGAFPAVGLAQARAELLKHQAVQEAAKKGEADHPAQEAKRQRTKAKAQLTVEEVFALWIEDKQLGSKRKGGEPVRQRTIDILTENFRNDVSPTLGSTKINRLAPSQVQACIDVPRKRGAPGAASHVYRTLRGLVNFALKRQLIDGADPMRGIENPRPYRPAPVNAANDDELVALMQGLAESALYPATRLAIQLQLLTGARPTEVREATWREFDLGKRLWIIPADRVKSGREFKIHLSTAAIAVLEEARSLSDSATGPVLPGKSGKPLDKMAVARALRRLQDRVIARGGKPLTPHDLRRSFRTLLSRLGVAPHIAELCMNHQEKEVMRRVYDGHDYFAEMGSAWDLVGQHISLLRKSTAQISSVSNSVPERDTGGVSVGDFLGLYPKVLAKHGLLKDAKPPERPGPPPTHGEVAKAAKKHYLANLGQLAKEDPAIRAALRDLMVELPAVKPGPSAKLTNTQTFMLVQLLRLEGATHKEACGKVAAIHGLSPESVKTKHFEGKREFERRRNHNAG